MGLLRRACPLLAALLMVPAPLPVAADGEGQVRAASAEAADALRRYRDQRLSSAYYDPSGRLPDVPYGPRREARSALSPKKDAHAGVRGYGRRSCESCHEDVTANPHTLRGNMTCRQCHGPDPIASSDHYFSSMNPIRRHAYVCAKCHEGAGASFATYVVHTPDPTAPETRRSFPALYWTEVFMYALIVAVFLIFLPHGVAWWIREWFVNRRKEA